MKTESYTKAKQNIFNKVGQALMRQVPTLDYIMNVADMSPEDRVFFDAYKKYGNRNHTWQDFKLMFYGDVETMQKTVRHWKTWDEINDLLIQKHALLTDVRALLAKYDIQTIDETKEEYQSYKKLYPDLVSVYEKYMIVDSMAHSNYSTYNPQIAKLEREFESKLKSLPTNDKQAKWHLIAEYVEKMDNLIDLENGDFVVAERIERYRDIIFNNPQILKIAVNFDNLSGAKKVDLARMILNASAKAHGTPIGTVSHDDAENGSHNLPDGAYGGYNRLYERFDLKSEIPAFSRFASFLQIVAHEDAHRIDYYNANNGMIGTQLMNFVDNNYVNHVAIGNDLYKKWATEQSSYYLEETTAAALDYMIRKSRDLS